jgi:hypothetical protein
VSNPSTELFPIGLVSVLTGLRPAALRRWERQGLIAPVRAGRRRRRLYSWRDVEQIQHLRHLIETEKLSPLQARAAVQEGWPRFTGWENRLWGRRRRPPRRGGARVISLPESAFRREDFEE